MTRIPILFLLLILPLSAQTTDDFADGNDDGWIHFDPIALSGGGDQLTFDVTDETYRLSAPTTPNPAFGPARGAALREEIYSDFCISVDVPSHDLLPEQAFGLIARVQANPGPGNVQGYAMTYHPADLDIQITRLEGELPIEISQFVFLSQEIPEGGLRLVFFGVGETLVGRAYDPADPTSPLAETITIDDTHSSGFSGIVVSDNSETLDQAPDATFDNFFASGTMEAPKLSIVPDSKNEFGLTWEFPFLHHFLEEAPSLQSWQEADRSSSIVRYTGSSFEYFFENSTSDPETSYFRLRTEDVNTDEVLGILIPR